MIMAAWAAFKLSRAFKPVLGIVAVIAILGLVFALGRCSGDDGAAEQANQTNRSADAVAGAAEAAVETIGERQATEKTIDAAVAAAVMEIGNAENVDDVRNAVLDGLCGQNSHRNDPACDMQPDNP